ncbi:MAG TPA: ATP-binding protein [Chitinophagaceae bacterium]|nr:ATP-binding protein [Chitinophagaceae bacterium]
MPYQLPAAIVKKQLHYDLIGKDSQRGITLSYGWLANQCGHCMLGFIPTHMLYLLLSRVFHVKGASWKAAVSIALFWTLFEIYNVVKPIRQQKKEGALFEPDWKNIIHDTATDLGFFATGALLAGIFLGFNWYLLAGLLIVGVVLIKPSKHWYYTKIFQQAAEFPFQFRLSQWNCNMGETDRKTVLQFLDRPKAGYHLLITGAYRTGKTSLAVAIANEWSIRHRTAKYATAIKLFSWMVESDLLEPTVPSNLWNWRQADCLVIDDLNTGLAHSGELISPAVFLQHMKEGSYATQNLAALQQLNTIWVLGDIASVSAQTLQNSWQQMLSGMGIPADKIIEIDLSRSA